MRLICPNCGAQYEVDAGLIPDTGRDVQCSNCGHGWFQHPDDGGPAAPDVVSEDAAEPSSGAKRRRELDPNVAEVLREEAEREAAARRAESEGLESQPDLGLDDPDEEQAAADRSAAARARMARMRGQEDEAAATDAAAPARARSEMLPDVEEINSTLRGDEDRDTPPTSLIDEDEDETHRGGFRAGFTLVVVLVVVGVAVYALAPQIATAVPDTAPYLESYVDWVNALRLRVNGVVDGAINWGRGLIGSAET